MVKILFLMLFFGYTQISAQEDSAFSSLTNITGIPNPPAIVDLPDISTISSILNSETSLEAIVEEFGESPEYTDNQARNVPEIAQGVWGRFYTLNTSLFNIPAVSEEILSISTQEAFWIQDVKTQATVNSRSQRRLQVSYFNLFNHMFLVFYYPEQDPVSQKIRDKQGFFIRVLPDKSYMQMSTSPNFEPDKSMYWRRFPQAVPQNKITQ